MRVACLEGGEDLLEVVEAFSPRIQSEGSRFYLDLGRPHDELELASALTQRLTKHRLVAGIGIASNKLIARLAARDGGLRIVPPGQEKRFLAPLPCAVLAPSERLARTLERWGIRTLGELAKLPSEQMITHLGKEGWELHQAARGRDPHPFVPFQRTPIFMEKIDFDWAVYELEPFLLAAAPLLERLALQLARSGMACRRLEVGLRLDPKGEDRRSIRLRAPTQDVKTLLRLIHTHLAAKPPTAPLEGVTLIAHPDMPEKAQLSLFGPASLSPAQLATTLAQLALLLGEDRVGSPATVDGYRPERYAVVEYDPPPPPLLSPSPPSRQNISAARGVGKYGLLLTVRVLRPAWRLEVRLADRWPSEPLHLRALGKAELAGEVRAASGPWRLEDQWWSPEGIWRDYWDVELHSGALYRIYHDRRNERWYADGIYD